MLFRVVKCFKCNFYQVDSVKKAKKWQCKMCGENQSLQQEFATGSAKDCRLQVQSLNKQRADTNAEKHEFASKVLTGEIKVPELEENAPESSLTSGSKRWLDCVDEEEAEEGKMDKGSIFSKDFKSARDSLSSRTGEEDRNYSEPDLPSWRDFLGNKRESASEKREFQENSSKFFSSQYYERKSTPLPELLDYTKMNRGHQDYSQKPLKETNVDETAREFQPLTKKFKPAQSSSKKIVQEVSSNSKWDSLYPSDDDL